VVDVILRDGTTLRLRPPAAEDADALLAFFAALSDESRYLRFNGVRRVDEKLVEPVLEPDWRERGALVGTLTDDGKERIVALGNYVRFRDPALAESAFVVSDELQGRGIGTRLLEQLAARAAASGIEGFVAEVSAANSSMLGVFKAVGFEVARTSEHGETEVRFPIAVTEGFRARVDERDHVAVAASLASFFTPKNVAVIGASRRRGSIGGELFRNVLAADFDGAAYPVNRSGKPVAGVLSYATVEDIPQEVDLAVICLPGAQVLEAAASCLRQGVRALCVISSGFAETGAEGRERQAQLLALVRAHGARLVGPNCLGIASTAPRLNATFAPRELPPGRIGLSSQSGALGLALLEKAAGRNLGFSSFVSIGNKADVSSNDLLEWWEEDPETDVVLLYLESFGNPRKFGRVAGRVARSKPILAMRSGTSHAGARAAASHTAALAGSDAVVDALFRQAGVLRASTLQELLDTAVLLTALPAPAGNRVAVVTNAGGLGILCADACEAQNLELPELTADTLRALSELTPVEASLANPIDLLGSANAALYERVLPLILGDPNIDSVIAVFVPPVVETARAVEEVLARYAGSSAKPLLSVVLSADGSAHGGFEYPESAARALGLAAQRAAWLRRPAGTTPDVSVDAVAGRAIVDAAPEGWLEPDAAHALLTAYGIPLVGEQHAGTADEAAAAASELGLPVVVKTAAAGAHKTETGGVALDLRTAAEVREAAARMGGAVVVQQYLTEGTELLAGLVQDPVFGPLVAFGPGGVLAELIGSANFALAPLTDVDAGELIGTGKAAKLVDGWRGAPAADRGALTDLLHRLSRLAVDLPEVSELDLNPVLARPDGCVAVDARIRITRPSPVACAKTW
jgi:acetyl coenzyme A synthetase (ADP forming)-like protein